MGGLKRRIYVIGSMQKRYKHFKDALKSKKSVRNCKHRFESIFDEIIWGGETDNARNTEF